ncbi:MAG: carbohydrate ABC transporter permease [Culicoidibacterales bacterium]
MNIAKIRRKYMGYLFIAPWIVGFLIFTLYPIGHSLFLSFQNVKLTTEGIATTNVGLSNYVNALTSDISFVNMLLEFAQELIISIPIVIVFSLIIAMLLNQKIKMKGVFRTIFFLPVIIASGPVIQELANQGLTSIPNIDSYFFYEMLAQNSGNMVVDLLLYLLDNIVSILWFSGVQILIFLAALQKIDRSMFEAAMIDGASTWEIFWKITLPSLKPMILVNVMYTIVTISVFSLNPVIAHIKSNMFEITTGFGYASALSWIYFIVIVVILLGSLAILSSKKDRA